MKLDILLNVNPELYDAYMELFEEYAHKYYDQHRQHLGRYEDVCLKFAEPDDIIFNGTHNKYDDVYHAGIESNVFNCNYHCRVPVGQEALFVGWYCDVSFKGLLSVRQEGIIRHKIPVHDVYNNKNPPHYFFSTNVVHFRENDRGDFLIYNDDSDGFDVHGEIYPLVVLFGDRRRFTNGFVPLKIRISNPQGVSDPYGLMEAMKRLEKSFNPIPYEFVTVKNEDGDEETEMRARLDPEFQEWLKCLKNGDVCQFCGYKITRIQKYCHYCGVPILKLEESLKEIEEITPKKGIETFIGSHETFR